MGAVTAVAAATVMPTERRWIGRAVAWAGAGLTGAAAVLAPVLASMLTHLPAGAMNASATYSVDLLNLVVPTRITALGGAAAAQTSARFSGNLAEQVGYLGLPLLLLLADISWVDRHSPRVRLLSIVLTVAAALSMGPRLHIAGRATVWLPGAVLQHVPVLDDALPARFALYLALAAGVLVALWLARPRGRGRWRWPAAALAGAALVPAAAFPWRSTPPAIAHDDLARIVPAGATVVSLPFWRVDDRGLYAQAVAGMRFRLDDRWLQLVPAGLRRAADSPALAQSRLTAAEVPAFERAICALGADYAVVWNDAPGGSRFLAALGLRPVRADDLLVYRLPRRACR
jgi:hypothetical protein